MQDKTDTIQTKYKLMYRVESRYKLIKFFGFPSLRLFL